ncbi:MAG: sigma 54-interacting transcriptional regulator, partial [Bacteroidota bacterium]
MTSTELANTVEFLKNVSFFSEVGTESLTRLCKDLSFESFRNNETVFKKGDAGDALYVILEGAVKVHEEDHVFGAFETGHCFGEYALIDQKERSATVTTTQRARLLKIPKAHFMDLMSDDVGFAKGILQVMILRHRELDSTQERLAASTRELSLANTKMSGLIDGAMDAIIMFDGKFRILLTNPSARLLLENEDPVQRNVLFFFDEASATTIETIVLEDDPTHLNTHLPAVVKVIGTNETETLNEGTLSKFGNDESIYYTLILRNLAERMEAEDQINLLTTQTQYLNEEIRELTSSYGILAEHESMLHVLELIDQVATTTATVLITGETGTGKELVARAIHKASDRTDKPLIRVNCGAIPANLIESELFGHEKGAFTGATLSRKGRFLLADKGTIFLDEIGELPLDLQPKLLRVIQEGEFDPLGSSETISRSARFSSGLSVLDYMKRTSILRCGPEQLDRIG